MKKDSSEKANTDQNSQKQSLPPYTVTSRIVPPYSTANTLVSSTEPETLIPSHVCPRLLIITGPTASGKSDLAAELAFQFQGEIINADSMQAYNAIPILTNQPHDNLLARAPHHLFGYVNPSSHIQNVKSWLNNVTKKIFQITKRQKIPIVCGGSGLYLHSLIHGISPVPDIPQHIRNAIRLRMIHEGPHALHHELSSLSPACAQKLSPCDSSRITRALEVLIATEKPLSQWQQIKTLHFINPQNTRTLLVLPEKESWKKRCGIRVHNMIQLGLLEEIEHIHSETWLPLSPLHKAIGLAPLIAYTQGKISLEEATMKIIHDTQRYGKRQRTWFQHQLSPHTVISDSPSKLQTQNIALLMDEILRAINSSQTSSP